MNINEKVFKTTLATSSLVAIPLCIYWSVVSGILCVFLSIVTLFILKIIGLIMALEREHQLHATRIRRRKRLHNN